MGQSFSSEKITLEDVIFRYLMDLSSSAAQIRTSMDLDYQKNADNYYFQVLTLWSILSDYLDPDVKKARILLLIRAEKKYNSLIEEQAKKPAVVMARRDEIVSLTFSVAAKTLSLMSECLSKKGILRERSAQSVAGEGTLEDIDNLTAENPEGEEGVVLGGPQDVPPQFPAPGQ